jgi:DNA-binding CsgD family transcriptional regulator
LAVDAPWAAAEDDPVAVRPSRGAPPLIRRGVELVVLAEELYLQLFVLTLGLVGLSAVLSIWFATTSSAPELPSILLSLAGGVFAVAGLRRPRALYGWLRYSWLRQLIPGLASGIAMVLTGPDSPLWWLALALVIAVSTISSLPVSLLGATFSAAGYAVGTVIGGEQLLHGGNSGVLPGVVGLVAYPFVGAVVSTAFARFVLGLGRPGRAESTDAGPLRVPNIAGTGRRPVYSRPVPVSVPRPRRRTQLRSTLTPRQHEVVLLIRDGLNQSEAGAALGISRRQVERLLTEARERAGAATTSQLVAMLVTDELVA